PEPLLRELHPIAQRSTRGLVWGGADSGACPPQFGSELVRECLRNLGVRRPPPSPTHDNIPAVRGSLRRVRRPAVRVPRHAHSLPVAFAHDSLRRVSWFV